MKIKQYNSGFTLIEVLIVLILLSGGFMILLQALNTSMFMRNKSELLTQQAVLLNNKIQEIRSRRFDESFSGSWSSQLGTDEISDNHIYFPGSNNYVQISNHSSQAISQNITLASWVKVEAFGNWDGVITKGINNSPYALQLWGNGSIRFTANWGGPTGYSGSGSWNSSGTLGVNSWHHIAVSYDGSNITFFIDGNIDSQVNKPGLVFGNNSESLILGADFPGGNEYFDGNMDEVAIWNEALSATEINALYNFGSELDATENSGAYLSESNLVGYWQMNEGTGTTVTDGSGNNNSGSLIGNISWANSLIAEGSSMALWDDIDDFNGYVISEIPNYTAFGCSVKVDYVQSSNGFHSAISGPSDYKRVMVEINHKTLPALRDTFIVSPGL